MPEQNLPADEQALAGLYQETINHQQVYLDKLHEAFNSRCEKIGEEAKEKLKGIDENDEEARRPILAEEQEKLDKTLEELKFAINKSNANARAKLEEIQNKIEASAVDLETELANL